MNAWLQFDWSLLGAPLLAGLLVASTHVLLGRRVLERGIIFIDLTIAQVAALGVILAGAHEPGVHPLAAQLPAALAALAAAALLAWTETRFPELQEALIGSLFVIAASVSMLVLSQHVHGAEHMQDLMAGQILWVGFDRLGPVAALSALLLFAWFAGLRRSRSAFYFLFALAITASVQLVGVFLVFATLILPAVATAGLPERRGLPLGYALAALAYGVGLWLSVPFDLPAGPLIVCMLATLALLMGVARTLNRKR